MKNIHLRIAVAILIPMFFGCTHNLLLSKYRNCGSSRAWTYGQGIMSPLVGGKQIIRFSPFAFTIFLFVLND